MRGWSGGGRAGDGGVAAGKCGGREGWRRLGEVAPTFAGCHVASWETAVRCRLRTR